MILAFEMTWTGSIHAPGNSATIQILARAFPGQQVRLHADRSHLDVLSRDPALTDLRNVELVPVPVSPLYRGRTQIVSPRRMAREFRTVRAALSRVPRDEPCLVFMVSTTATASFAAAWAAWLSGRRCGLQVGFHGNLNDATGWRSRNPLLRAFDTRSLLTARLPVPTRFLVLEASIRKALAETFPEAAERTDVLPLPINTSEIAAAAETPLSSPLRVGFVGLGTAAKGMDLFLSIAARVKRRWGDRVEIVHVGRMPPGEMPAGVEVLAHPPARDPLPREEFAARLASLHYVMLPFRAGYYDFSASGALIDALTWLKPVITTRVPLTAQFFEEYGDIGIMTETEDGLEAALEGLLAAPDPARHARQVAALRQARDFRRVEVLAQQYRQMVERAFPALLPA